MTEKEWTLDEIREELEKQQVSPLRTLRLPEETTGRLRSGRWRVVTISPGLSAAEVREVDDAELMWLMLRSIEGSEFVVSVTPCKTSAREAIEGLLKGGAR